MIASVAYLSEELTDDHVVANHRAQFLIENDEAWRDWRTKFGGSWYLTVEDRDPGKPLRRVKDDELSYAVDGRRIVEAGHNGRLIEEWLGLYAEMGAYWAEKKGGDQAPPVPRSDAPLPPEDEKFLSELQAGLVLDEAENEWIDELVDEEDD